MPPRNGVDDLAFSILERIDVGETLLASLPAVHHFILSVSSNGSTWVKLYVLLQAVRDAIVAFSILERIDVGETHSQSSRDGQLPPFSILERIDVGETCGALSRSWPAMAFQYPRTDRRG